MRLGAGGVSSIRRWSSTFDVRRLRSTFVIGRRRSLFGVRRLTFGVWRSSFAVRRSSPVVGGDVAVSTRDPPCEQWLAGLGAGARLSFFVMLCGCGPYRVGFRC